MVSAGKDPPKGSKSTLKVVVNIFISFIGAGVLGMPYAFRQAGLAEGAVIMVLVCVFAVKAMLILIECKYLILADQGGSDRVPLINDNNEPLLDDEDFANGDISFTNGKNNRNDKVAFSSKSSADKTEKKSIPSEYLTYSDVGFHAAGIFGQRLVDITVIISQIGFSCGYLIFITENLNSYLPSIGRQSWLVMILPPLFLLTLYRELHKLAFFSLFAQVSNLLAFAVVFWFDFDHIQQTKQRIHPTQWSYEGFPFFFAVAIFCYEGAGMILSLEMSVAKEKRHMFKNYFIVVMVFMTSLYIAFGAAGYLSYGSNTNPIVTLNLPNDEGLNFAMLVKLCLCCSLFFTYPVMIFPVTELIEKQFLTSGNKLQENLLRFCIVSSTGIVVTYIPSFANLMSLIGATCCTLLGFILPAMFHLLLKKRLDTKSKYIDYCLLFLGLTGALVGTMDTLHRLYSQRDITEQIEAKGPLLNRTTEAFLENQNQTSFLGELVGENAVVKNVIKSNTSLAKDVG